MQKLGIFIYSMGSGGAERVVATLLPTLMLKYEVHLVLMNDTIAYELPKDLQIHYLEHSKPKEKPLIKLLKLPLLALRYKKLVKSLNLDKQLVFLNRPNYIALLARIFGLKIPLIINECTTPSLMYAKKNFTSLANKLLIRLLYPKADLILANSRGNEDDLRTNFGIKEDLICVLYNAVDLDKIKSLSEEDIEIEDKFILNVGRLDSGKNHALLIKAYARLESDLKLVILGEGALQAELLSLIDMLHLHDKIILLGFDENPYKYMSKCKFFACTSNYEGFSNALIEALACGCAVVCTEHKSGARELFGDNEYGLLVKVNDEDALYEGLKTMCEDKHLRQEYEKKASKRAKDFDKMKIARELFELLGE
ncbi:N-acetylgalactosamine-N,N'-diacetylbacillosaminyl-diphospho-undecaprenol 4-alpha-N-acetylgalactosaminyltransferase [Campylobacter troglodytis]|uniref:N-acetylgalactosamine-N, N'-diacetylbacillosaminyl-diphospho-undecaprenol 4-alpha-N-acetylgalactosaminyltransferase n=1 Tax=Campylobacter troglodytis TaxID=654363 RepID=UPI00115B3E7E|nr:glycosyltransferase [Campylobacter troglodytis]TQR61005.1 glycosyltransferase [Campylobacter troglodytis]